MRYVRRILIAANQSRFTASSLSGRGSGNRYGTTALIYRTERWRFNEVIGLSCCSSCHHAAAETVHPTT
jgi:hypothetical protein